MSTLGRILLVEDDPKDVELTLTALEEYENSEISSYQSNRRLLLMVPVILSMGFAVCSDVAGTPRMHQAVNLQSAVTGEPQTGDNVTIGPRTYNSESKGFDRPWPFGPESGPQ